MIGYYAHHLGHGHVETARCIAARLTDEVTVLSSLPRPPGWPGGWLELPRRCRGGQEARRRRTAGQAA